MKPGRNELCTCGSGLKYKQCCEGRTIRPQWWRYGAIGLAGLLLGAGLVMALMDWASRESGPPGAAPPGKVWSEEHGHWHDLATQPQGPAPPGKVWSAEHGHWHDAAPGAGGSAPASQPPPGLPPPGKVWSEEHGHWHDAADGEDPGFDASDPVFDGTETSPAPAPGTTTDPNA